MSAAISATCNGMFPDRQAGSDWRGTLPGDRSELIWTGYLPPERTPQLWNPSSGLVFNANATPSSMPASRRTICSLPTSRAEHGHADQHDQPRPAPAGNLRR